MRATIGRPAGASAGARAQRGHAPARAGARATALDRRRRVAAAAGGLDVDLLNASEAVARADFLEAQARRVIRTAVDAAVRPAFPCALIAGDVVLLHLLATEGLLANDRVPVIFVDTFHLFDETHALLAQLEQAYDFTARVFRPAGFASKAEFVKARGGRGEGARGPRSGKGSRPAHTLCRLCRSTAPTCSCATRASTTASPKSSPFSAL